ncbi:MAG: oligosaccharide flippase family protein [Nitrososphaerales archaeon]
MSSRREYPVQGDASDQRARNITRGIGSLTIQNIVTSMLGFVFLAGLIRLLPPIQYGAYSAVSSSVGVGAAFATFGLQYASARFVASSTQDRWSAARATINLTLIFSSVVTLAFVLLSPYLSIYFMKSTLYTWLFLLGGLWLFTSSIQSILLGILQGLKLYSLIAKMLLVTRGAMVLFTLATLFVYRNIGVAVAAWVLYYIALILWTVIIARKSGVPFSSKEKTRSSYSAIMRYSLPLGIAVLMTIVASSSQIIVVGGYLDPISLGVFNAAVTISSVLALVLVGPLNTALFPEIASSSNQDQVSSGLRLAFRFMFLLVLPASLLVASVSNQVLILFTGGGKYLSGSGSLEIIATFYLFPAIQLVIYSVLQATGRTKQVLIVGGVTAITGVGASLVLVPVLGLDGAAISTVLVGLFGAIVAVYLARDYLGKTLSRTQSTFYSKAIISSAIPFAIILALSTFLSDGVLSLFPYLLLGLLVYLGLVKAFGILNEEDRGYLTHVLPGRLKRILGYI